jgi:hypothetical protein
MSYVYAGAGFEVGINKALPSGYRLSNEIQTAIRNQLQIRFADRFANIVAQYTDAGTAYVTGTSRTGRASEQDIYSDVLIALSGAGLRYNRSTGGILLHNNVPRSPYATNPQNAPEAQRQREVNQQEKYLTDFEKQTSFLYQFQKEAKDDLNTPLLPGVPAWALAAVVVVGAFVLWREL